MKHLLIASIILGLLAASPFTAIAQNQETGTFLEVGRLSSNSVDPGGKGIEIREHLTNLGAGGFYGTYVRNTNASPGSLFLSGGHFESYATADSRDAEGVAGISRIGAGANVKRSWGGFFQTSSAGGSGLSTLENAWGTWNRLNFGGKTSITGNLIGVDVDFANLADNSIVKNYYGIRVEGEPDRGKGVIENGYGIYVDTVSSTNKNYAIFQKDKNNKNYFAGNVGIAHGNPTYALEVGRTGDKIARFGRSGNTLAIDVAGGQGLANITAGAKANPNGDANYVFTGTRGASRIMLHDSMIRFFTSSERAGEGRPGEVVQKLNTDAYNLEIQPGNIYINGAYLQIDRRSGKPPVADCDNAKEVGRMKIDVKNNKIWVCGGKVRGWDSIELID